MISADAAEAGSGRYEARFFKDFADGSLRSARAALGHVFTWLSPRSVLDVGCGVGTWLHAARELGAEHILGADGDYVDRDLLRIPNTDFVAVDLERQSIPAALLPYRAPPFDLVMCVEVAEHLSFDRAPGFVQELTELGDVILFSAAVPFQSGNHHVNEQWPEYWALLFAAQGYRCVDALRPLLWNRDDIEWWYAQNALLFVREGCAALTLIPAQAAEGRCPLSLVHPQNLLFQVLHTFRTHRAAAADEEVRDYWALSAAWSGGGTTLPRLSAQERAAASPDAVDVFPLTRTQVMVPEHELAARDAAILRGAAEIAALKDALSGALSERDAAISRGEEEAAALRIKWRCAETAHLALAAEVAALRTRLLESDLVVTRTKAGLMEAGAKVRRLTAEVEALHASTSWKLTAPLRRLARAARRRPSST